MFKFRRAPYILDLVPSLGPRLLTSMRIYALVELKSEFSCLSPVSMASPEIW